MNARRFFAYCVLAAWIVATPITIKTALDWIAAETTKELAVEQTQSGGSTDERSVAAYRTELLKQLQLSWEAGVWAALTVIGSALLAQSRRSATSAPSVREEHHAAQSAVEV